MSLSVSTLSDNNKYSCVFVTWEDSATVDAWTEPAEIPKGANTIHSVGFLVRKNESEIALAHSHDTHSDDLCGILIIPASAILSIEFLSSKHLLDACK